MSSKDSLGDRVKSYYEDAYRIHLPRRMPVMLRLDGKSFHSYTKGCQRPFDQNLIHCLNQTAKYVCDNIQGAKIAYIQSDEISILLNNYGEINTQSYFDNNLQKIVSVTAALASSYFTSVSDKIFGKIKLAQFDCRAFVVPKEEVNNAFLWRQLDCTRNSIQMLARSLFSHKECNYKNTSQLKEMCLQKSVDWNLLSNAQKHGRCITKISILKECKNPKTNEITIAERSEWFVDNYIPLFSQEPNYIEKYL